MADRNPIFSEAVRTAVVLSNDEKIRLQCEAREDYYRRVGWKDEEIVNLTYEIQKLTSNNQLLASDNQQQARKIEDQADEIGQLTSEKQQLASEKQQLASENEYLRQLLKSAGISISDASAQSDPKSVPGSDPKNDSNDPSAKV